ncbi:MAG: N-acetylmuramoyl-L-alanine amidase, partial [Pseudomonadota bacterium]|nr:N-acetylmuramoyl-L-alanine amidase [Pseudomonadota bacterium]
MFARPAKLWTSLFALLGVLAGVAAGAATPVQLTDARLWSGPEGTRLVLDLSALPRHEVFTIENPDRVVVDLANTQLAMRKDLPVGQGPVKSVRSGPQAGGGLRIVLDLSAPQAVKSFAVGPDGSAGHRLVVELPGAAAAGPAPTAKQVLAASSAAIASEAEPSDDPVKTLSVAPGKQRDLVIAIDAGHGGQDPGAIGRGGT